MCGLVLVADATLSGLYPKEREMFWGMMLLNTFRGIDSTGMAAAWVEDNQKIDLYKVMGHPFNIQNQKNGKLFWDRLTNSYQFVMGHGRHATVGNVNIQGAHPFQQGKITLMHNGTLRNTAELKKKVIQIDKKYKDVTVDSEMVTILMDHHNPHEVFEMLEGAYALIYYDSKEKQIHFARNYERPLYYLRANTRKLFFLASEKSTLEWLLAKYTMKGDIKNVDPYKLYTNPVGTLELYEEDIKQSHKIYSGYGEMGGYYGGSNKPHPFEVSKPALLPATKSHPTDKYTLGETIQFGLTDYDELTNLASNGHRYSLTGYLLENPNIEVKGLYIGDIDPLLEEVTIWGTIRSIFKDLNGNNGRLFCEAITMEEQEEKLLDDEEDIIKSTGFLELFDKTRIATWRLEEIIAEGCEKCSDPIFIEQSQFIIVNKDKAICPDCTLKTIN